MVPWVARRDMFGNVLRLNVPALPIEAKLLVTTMLGRNAVESRFNDRQLGSRSARFEVELYAGQRRV